MLYSFAICAVYFVSVEINSLTLKNIRNGRYMINIDFEYGTLIINGTEEELKPVEQFIKYDTRIKAFRAEGFKYADIVLTLHRKKIKYQDNAKNFTPISIDLKTDFTPMPHQKDALTAWCNGNKRGVIEMPTGSGKSFLAMLAINIVKRPTIIIAPTIDLMQQWATGLEKSFDCQVGMLGGGSKNIQDITVSTYDSAVIMTEFIGNRFGFIIFDECHHLPSSVNKQIAIMNIAPYRLALTATLEREDGGENLLYNIVGPLLYNVHIDDLEGNVLSEYQTEQIHLALEEDELNEYEINRKIYINFVRANGINFSNKSGWSQFIIQCSRQMNGREAMNAYLMQKKIARSGRSKIKKLWELIMQHSSERIIIFTAENDSAYEIGKNFYLPVITHRTKAIERKDFLEKFRSGEYPILVTSKVLNEGVDVPEASVGIIVSGSGSIREHVQRLGRILRRKKDGKQAILYELISDGTSEEQVSERRRNHRAYN